MEPRAAAAAAAERSPARSGRARSTSRPRRAPSPAPALSPAAPVHSGDALQAGAAPSLVPALVPAAAPEDAALRGPPPPAELLERAHVLVGDDGRSQHVIQPLMDPIEMYMSFGDDDAAAAAASSFAAAAGEPAAEAADGPRSRRPFRATSIKSITTKVLGTIAPKFESLKRAASLTKRRATEHGGDPAGADPPRREHQPPLRQAAGPGAGRTESPPLPDLPPTSPVVAALDALLPALAAAASGVDLDTALPPLPRGAAGGGDSATAPRPAVRSGAYGADPFSAAAAAATAAGFGSSLSASSGDDDDEDPFGPDGLDIDTLHEAPRMSTIRTTRDAHDAIRDTLYRQSVARSYLSIDSDLAPFLSMPMPPMLSVLDEHVQQPGPAAAAATTAATPAATPAAAPATAPATAPPSQDGSGPPAPSPMAKEDTAGARRASSPLPVQEPPHRDTSTQVVPGSAPTPAATPRQAAADDAQRNSLASARSSESAPSHNGPASPVAQPAASLFPANLSTSALSAAGLCPHCLGDKSAQPGECCPKRPARSSLRQAPEASRRSLASVAVSGSSTLSRPLTTLSVASAGSVDSAGTAGSGRASLGLSVAVERRGTAGLESGRSDAHEVLSSPMSPRQMLASPVSPTSAAPPAPADAGVMKALYANAKFADESAADGGVVDSATLRRLRRQAVHIAPSPDL